MDTTEKGNVSFSQTHLDFLLRYGQARKAKFPLFTLGVIEEDDLPEEISRKSTFVDLTKKPKDAFKDAMASDLSVIIPPFGRFRAFKETELPDEIDDLPLGARQHLEDAWLLWGINNTQSQGLVLAVTSEGMLNSALRQPIREYVISQGLEKVILLGATFQESLINTALLVVRRGNKADKILLVDASNLKEDWEWATLADALNNHNFTEHDLKIWHTDINTSDIRADRIDPSFYHPRYLQIEPQKGYTEYILSDIADIRGGRSLPH